LEQRLLRQIRAFGYPHRALAERRQRSDQQPCTTRTVQVVRINRLGLGAIHRAAREFVFVRPVRASQTADHRRKWCVGVETVRLVRTIYID